ncbi:MAG TPA: grasp-with-spasm system SPASM domain peptide maturase [Longimicrobium sp.]|nr:grasp-with-spasm system SPASM domain peptide maturase [Longimicrobium sp.]
MLEEHTPFILFANCVPVRGARRSTICDLQRGRVHPIPNGLHEVVTAGRGRTMAELRAIYGAGAGEVLEEYFTFLVDNELGFWCNDPSAFPPLDLSWDHPGRVSNSIVDVGPESDHDFAALIGQLDELGCRALQLRVFAPWPLARLDAALACAAGSRLRSVEVIFPWSAEWTAQEMAELVFRHQRVSSMLVHSAPEGRLQEFRPGDTPVHYTEQVIDSHAHCGEVHPGYFAVTLGAFTEARSANSCLNRKISIDEHGEIRNCPSMPRSFGNAACVPLAAALEADGFREHWGVSKDQVSTCRDCEFRFVCTDCRAWLRDPADARSKPARCSYDPYTAAWGSDPTPGFVEAPRLPEPALAGAG